MALQAQTTASLGSWLPGAGHMASPVSTIVVATRSTLLYLALLVAAIGLGVAVGRYNAAHFRRWVAVVGTVAGSAVYLWGEVGADSDRRYLIAVAGGLALMIAGGTYAHCMRRYKGVSLNTALIAIGLIAACWSYLAQLR